MLSSTPGGAIGDPLSATNTREPSRLRRTPRGRLPTGMVATTFCVATSITLMSPLFSLLTKSRPAVGGATGAAAGVAAGALDDEDGSGPEHADTSATTTSHPTRCTRMVSTPSVRCRMLA